MTLLEVCEPLLQYICRLNRSARKGVSVEINQTRREVETLMSQMRETARGAGLSDQFERIRLPLVYFVDFMIKESEIEFAKRWEELAHADNMYAGDEHFWDLLDETLAEQGPQADERLKLFYTMIGLGFTGFYVGQPEHLRKKMLEIWARIRGRSADDERARICPETYAHIDTSNLIQPPGRSLMGIVIVLIVLLLVLLAGSATLYLQSSSDLRSALNSLTGGGA